jgi:hypothetical protein
MVLQLTKVLSGCFDGRSRTVWIPNVSPLKEDHAATLAILEDAHDVSHPDQWPYLFPTSKSSGMPTREMLMRETD